MNCSVIEVMILCQNLISIPFFVIGPRKPSSLTSLPKNSYTIVFIREATLVEITRKRLSVLLLPCSEVQMYSSVIFSRAASNVRSRWLEKYFLFIKGYHIINHAQVPLICVIPEEIFHGQKKCPAYKKVVCVYMHTFYKQRTIFSI